MFCIVEVLKLTKKNSFGAYLMVVRKLLYYGSKIVVKDFVLENFTLGPHTYDPF